MIAVQPPSFTSYKRPRDPDIGRAFESPTTQKLIAARPISPQTLPSSMLNEMSGDTKSLSTGSYRRVVHYSRNKAADSARYALRPKKCEKKKYWRKEGENTESTKDIIKSEVAEMFRPVLEVVPLEKEAKRPARRTRRPRRGDLILTRPGAPYNTTSFLIHIYSKYNAQKHEDDAVEKILVNDYPSADPTGSFILPALDQP